MRSLEDFRPGQVSITAHVYENDGGIIVLEMGGGKTAAFLQAIKELVRDGFIDRAVVSSPPKVAANVWPNEPAKWSQLADIEVFDATGNPDQRAKQYKAWAASSGVLSVSTANLKAIKTELASYDASRTLLLFDEISALKSPTGKLAKTAEVFGARFWSVWGCTGTPRPNGWEDLFRPVRIVSKGTVWGDKNFTNWRRDHFRPMDMKGYEWKIHSFAVPKLEKEIENHVFLAPTEHLEGMPELRIGADFDRVIELPDEARAAYAKMERDLLVRVMATLGPSASEEAIVVALSKAAGSMKLEQIAQGYLYDEGEAITTLHNEKRDTLADMLLAAGSDPVIVTYKFKADLAAIRDVVGGTFPILGGGTSPAAAQRHIEAFRRGSVPVLALHPASAGHGVDGLQEGGRRMIWYAPTWSNEQYDQTVKRLYRPGQLQTTYSHRIVAKDTVDELKLGRVADKDEQQRAFKAMLKRVGL